MPPADFYTSNRQRLLDKSEVDLIVIAGHVELQRSHDTGYPIRQDSNFLYLSGVDAAGAILIFDKHRSALLLPSQNNSEQIFDGAHNYSQIKARSGVDEVLSGQAANDYFNKLVKSAKTIGTLKSYQSPIWATMWPNPARARLLRMIRRQTAVKITDLRADLASLRMQKQPIEIEQITKAVDHTLSTIQEIEAKAKSYQFEYEIEADITAGFRRRGATGHAYSPIVANGRNATTLHYTANDSTIDAEQLTLIDVGAEVNGYAADITRILSHRQPSSRQMEVISAVRELQDYAISLLEVGIDFKEYELNLVSRVGKTLINLGLIQTVTDANVRKYYPHRTSHFLGLDVHDVGDYSKPLVANSVVTVEPGIYIPEESIGVRIEDDVLITPTGAKILG